MQSRLVELARRDPSPLLRLYLAAAIQRLTDDLAWQLAEALSQHAEDASDRNLPQMIWFGLAPLIAGDLDRAFQLAEHSRMPALRHFLHWYAAKGKGEGLDRVMRMMAHVDGQAREQLLEEVVLALEGQYPVKSPRGWDKSQKCFRRSVRNRGAKAAGWIDS